MISALDALETAIAEVARLEKIIKDGRPRKQVTLSDERALAKSTAFAWFNNHKDATVGSSSIDVSEIDHLYRTLLESSERAAARTTYLLTMKALKKHLVALRSDLVLQPSQPIVSTADQAPSFAPLITDSAMQRILIERWHECMRCLDASAPLAATVMMGGLIEALLLARVNREPNKTAIFTARAAPKDRAANTRPLSDWTLKDYIDVAHELGWISQSARDISVVLRDYRNYVHPQKQLSHNLQLALSDAQMLWEVCKSISRQIIA